MVEGIHSYTATGKMRRASYSEVCEWVLKAWEAIPVTTITNGFRKAGITDTAAVDEDDEDAFREDEVEEEPAILNNEWLALFHSDTEDEHFEGF